MGIGKLRRRGAIGVFNKLSHGYWALKSRFYYGPQFASFGRGTVIRKPLFISNPGGIEIGSGTFIRDGVRLEVVDRHGERRGRLIIGNDVSLEQMVHIAAGGIVSIGDHVCIASRVSILDTTHPLGDPTDGNRVHAVQAGDTFVTIGRRAFIGTGSVVLPGVTIGENAVVGAGSVVTRDVPANAIVAGVPARLVRMLPATSPR